MPDRTAPLSLFRCRRESGASCKTMRRRVLRRFIDVAVAAFLLLCLCVWEDDDDFVQPPRNLYIHQPLAPVSRRGAHIFRAQRPADEVIGDLWQYVIAHAWRTWFFTTLLLLGLWSARGFGPLAGVALFLAHPNVYFTFALQAVRVYIPDWQRVASGIHSLPYDATFPYLCQWAHPSRIKRFCRASGEAIDRAIRRSHQELPASYLPGPNGPYPDYYLQNYHFQTDGWLSSRSASTYDMCSEAFFGGTQDAMLRLTFVPIHEWFRRRGQGNSARVLHAGCGTGRLICQLADNWPRMQFSAVDLSPYYLDACRLNWNSVHTNDGSRDHLIEFIHARVEDLPVPDSSHDIVVCSYLFNGLPPEERRSAAKEIFRVLRPGGLFVLADSVQKGDLLSDVLVDWFPRVSHEPYYSSWVEENLDLLFGFCGFRPFADVDVAHVTKVAAWVKPGGRLAARQPELEEQTDLDGVPAFG